MNIAFLHYHLKPGGVTTVIKHQINAVKDACDIMVLSGEPTKEELATPVYHIPGLAYDTIGGSAFNPKETADKIVQSLSNHFSGQCDILHVHNATLAKNKNLLTILKELQKRGLTLFLQLHDFAEDGRPHAYFKEPYPENCHYGVINSRDYDLLKRAGFIEDGLHKLPNTIAPLSAASHKRADQSQFVLYPIRGLRRKNIGEAILLSLFFKDKMGLYITLPPNSPDDMKSYRDWKAFSRANQLPVNFDVGLESCFSHLVNA